MCITIVGWQQAEMNELIFRVGIEVLGLAITTQEYITQIKNMILENIFTKIGRCWSGFQSKSINLSL